MTSSFVDIDTTGTTHIMIDKDMIATEGWRATRIRACSIKRAERLASPDRDELEALTDEER